ncbi:DUF1156 domain-containing protein [Kocuria rhizophila]|uniref:DUF1156 domain-containing protein n=2 Tax=Kocuria rhizophila TaxID=72000 RepID=UPI0021A2703F|nr:DUF1156 domain-containing protein [Kocuria rhizophila]MCT1916382.1 DUF1156 domain-containing protein [Kocuria rhizophila]
MKRKLIEVSIPLEAINEQSAREKSIRHGHPSTLHLWWARRPLAAARSVLFAQLVDDPSSFEDLYREEARAQGVPADEIDEWVEDRIAAERARLHQLMTELSDWDNLGNAALWERARQEILKSTDGNPPPIVDPFAGGGSIPLEAQRLGLEAHASDLNPVAVLINRAMIEIPPKFANRRPVHPSAESRTTWAGAQGLAEDVRRYGEWMRDEAHRRIGDLYPDAHLEDGSTAPVIAWIWARTVTCPNPACGVEMPLVRSWWLGKKKGKEAYVVPRMENDRVEFSIGHDPDAAPSAAEDGTVGRRGAHCVACGTHVDLKYVRAEAKDGRMGERLMAVVAQGSRSRTYLAPGTEHEDAASMARPNSAPTGDLPVNPRDFKTPNYGMNKWSDLFTNRQLVALTTFSDLVGEARNRVLEDAAAAGMELGDSLADGGTGSLAYADSITTYLSLIKSRVTSKMSSIASWDSSKTKEGVRGVFARQAIPMTWDFAEASPFANSGGSFDEDTRRVALVVEKFPESAIQGYASQLDATARDYQGLLISTDPPYYDNIGYSDLSDFFYVWLRRSLRRIHPDLFGTMLVPKAEELVANPYRHGGKDGAQEFFEHGFNDVFARARESAGAEYPITVFYAFKQSETGKDGTASTGWETLLEGMIKNRWQVTGTWPMRSELSNRMLASGTNALASSIVLALRPRPEGAGITDQRTFRDELLEELPDRLHELQQGTIAPVDLPQAAIGPGMAIYSRYDRVLQADGSSLTVRQALQMINGVLDEVLNEQENDFHPETRWCVKWYAQNGFAPAPYGTAETLASAVNTSVAGLARSGAVKAGGGEVKLLSPNDLPSDYRPDLDNVVTLWEVTLQTATALTREGEGIETAGTVIARSDGRVDRQAVKDLAFLVFSLAEKRKDSATAQLFNTLATSWPEITAVADRFTRTSPNHQTTLDLG